MLGEGGSYFGKDDLFFSLRNYLPDRIASKRAFLLCQRRRGQFMGDEGTQPGFPFPNSGDPPGTPTDSKNKLFISFKHFQK